jgi:hypothetical protein
VNENLAARVPRPPLDRLRRYLLRPAGGPARTPWFEVPSSGRFGVFVAGTPGPSDRLELEWARGTTAVASAPVSANLRAEVRPRLIAWRFLAASELPPTQRGATSVRIAFRGRSGAPLAVTAPVTYDNESLTERIRREPGATLVVPNMFMYTPCVTQPTLGDGAVAVPSQIVAHRSTYPLGGATSPFDGVFDVYLVNRLSLTDSPDPVLGVTVYEVDRRIAGSVLLAPDRRRS